ncbi:hypothetical protein NKG05_02260 [Oerskovia sp. M15]
MTTTHARIAIATCSVLPHLDSDDALSSTRSPSAGSRQCRRSGTTRRSTGPRSTPSSSAPSGTTPAPGRVRRVGRACRRVLNPRRSSAGTPTSATCASSRAGRPGHPDALARPRAEPVLAGHPHPPSRPGRLRHQARRERGAKDTGRYQSGEAHSRGLAIQHAKNLLVSGRQVMVQPYVRSVDTAGRSA